MKARADRKKLLACLFLNTISLAIKLKIRRKVKWWVRPAWTRRESHGDYNSLVKSLATEDPEYFQRYLRMNPEDFKVLKKLIAPYIRKYPAGRKALSVGHRLAITLRFLSTGNSLASIAFSFRIGISTAHYVVKETCEALWKSLKRTYLKVPTKEDWEDIEKGFNLRNFPNCVGAVDGKHIEIQALPNSGSMYFNYKVRPFSDDSEKAQYAFRNRKFSSDLWCSEILEQGYFSTVLMAVVDAKYKFVVADVGSYGSNSDGGVWKNSSFGKTMERNEVPFPAEKKLTGFPNYLPHVLVGDEAFQLKPNFMRAFPGKTLTTDRRIFNYRLSRARRCSENAFGILVCRWRILKGPIQLAPGNTDSVVKAVLVLHNFPMSRSESSSSTYCPRGFADQLLENGDILDGEWRSESNVLNTLDRTHTRNFTGAAEKVREDFLLYFNTVGRVEWQNCLA